MFGVSYTPYYYFQLVKEKHFIHHTLLTKSWGPRVFSMLSHTHWLSEFKVHFECQCGAVWRAILFWLHLIVSTDVQIMITNEKLSINVGWASIFGHLDFWPFWYSLGSSDFNVIDWIKLAIDLLTNLQLVQHENTCMS